MSINGTVGGRPGGGPDRRAWHPPCSATPHVPVSDRRQRGARSGRPAPCVAGAGRRMEDRGAPGHERRPRPGRHGIRHRPDSCGQGRPARGRCRSVDHLRARRPPDLRVRGGMRPGRAADRLAPRPHARRQVGPGDVSRAGAAGRRLPLLHGHPVGLRARLVDRAAVTGRRAPLDHAGSGSGRASQLPHRDRALRQVQGLGSHRRELRAEHDHRGGARQPDAGGDRNGGGPRARARRWPGDLEGEARDGRRSRPRAGDGRIARLPDGLARRHGEGGPAGARRGDRLTRGVPGKRRGGRRGGPTHPARPPPREAARTPGRRAPAATAPAGPAEKEMPGAVAAGARANALPAAGRSPSWPWLSAQVASSGTRIAGAPDWRVACP